MARELSTRIPRGALRPQIGSDLCPWLMGARRVGGKADVSPEAGLTHEEGT